MISLRNFFFIPFLFLLVVLAPVMNISGISHSSPEQHTWVLNPTTFGGAISAVEGHSYRVQIASLNADVVLDPLDLQGSAEFTTGAINSTGGISAVIEVVFNVTERKDNGWTSYIMSDILFNKSLGSNSDTIGILSEVDHDSMVSIVLTNGSRVLITSYAYFTGVTEKSLISSTLNLYLEASNHSDTWSHQVKTVELQGKISYMSDPDFYSYLETRNAIPSATSAEKTAGISLTPTIIGLFVLMGLVPSIRHHF